MKFRNVVLCRERQKIARRVNEVVSQISLIKFQISELANCSVAYYLAKWFHY